MALKSVVLFVTLCSALLSMGGCSPRAEGTALVATRTAFVDVEIIPMDSDTVLSSHTVLVEDGVITLVGPTAAVTIPSGTNVIEGRGRYLMPGLTDFHVHLRAASELQSYLRFGVTSIVHMSGAMSGAPDLLGYREALQTGTMDGPLLLTTGPIIDGEPPIFGGVSVSVDTPEEARRAVQEQKKLGYDFIKVYNNLSPEALRAVCSEAHKSGMAVLGHIPRAGGREHALQRALDAGIDMIAHGEEFFFTYFYGPVDSLLDLGAVPHPDMSRLPAAVRMARESGVAVTPNLSFIAMTDEMLRDLDRVLGDPEFAHLEPGVREMWMEQNPTLRPDLDRFTRREEAKYPFVKTLTAALQDAGVLLLLGTDASAPGLFPGKSAHREIAELVDAGLSPFEALATGTRNAGEFIASHSDSYGRLGQVAEEYVANLVLLQENPLHNPNALASIAGVMVQGRWHPSPSTRN